MLRLSSWFSEKHYVGGLSALLASTIVLSSLSAYAAGTVTAQTKVPADKQNGPSDKPEKGRAKSKSHTSSSPTKSTTPSAPSQKATATTSSKQSPAASQANPKAAQSTAAQPGDVLRLTKEVKPSLYDLTFQPDLQKFTYSGKETITLDIASARKEIILHALEMSISDVEITLADGSKKQLGSVEMDPKNEQAKLSFPQELSPGKYKLQLKFSAILNDSLRGFYRSYYKDKQGEKHWLCSSQMEPSDARRMFPCFDEPEFKAVFQLNAVIDKKLAAISNAPIDHVTEINESNKRVIAFQPTPRMSTYLMVLVVGEFSSTEEKISAGVPIRVWAPTGQESMGSYALGAAAEIMVFLQDYFGIKFPAKKLDLIAIPDFAPGAMENLGAITFKDSLLLIDEKTGSNFAKRSALSVIAHEMAHQWFGDLVTNRWWDDLWLNEAFATWAATKTEHTLRPAWRVRTKGVVERMDAMAIDQLASTRAIRARVGNPKQASEMFDAITYDKGSAVLRMLEVFVGEKNFQQGVHDYLEAHKFDNATSEDLWNSIGAASKGVPVAKMMGTWITQPGFPLVTMGKAKTEGKFNAAQSRFLVMPGAKAGNEEWLVPLMARSLSSNSKTESFLLDKKQNDFACGDSSPLLNAGASGFYRVLYSEEQTNKLLEKFEDLTPEERLSLMSDIAYLARKGDIPVEQSLDIMLKVKADNDTIVLNSLVNKFSSLRYLISPSNKDAYEKLIRNYLLPLKKRVGWEESKGEEDTLKDLRADLIRILGTYGQDADTIEEANKLFEKYMKDRESVSPDMVSTVLGIVAYNGTAKEYDRIKEAMKSAANPQEEKRFLLALTEFRQSELISRTLESSLAEETRATDSVSILTAMLGRMESNQAAWAFVSSNWDKLSKKFPPRFNKRIAASCSSFNSAEMEHSLNAYFAAHPMEMAKAAVSRSLEEVRIAVLFKEKNQERIQNWLQKNSADTK